jgi:hypothetical protein
VIFEKEEILQIKTIDSKPGLYLMGFKPASALKVRTDTSTPQRHIHLLVMQEFCITLTTTKANLTVVGIFFLGVDL